MQNLPNPYHQFAQGDHSQPLTRWLNAAQAPCSQRLYHSGHGDYPRWRAALESLPASPADVVTLDTARVSCQPNQADTVKQTELHSALQGLKPWRKGPFDIMGIYIDSEWRCDMKWARVWPHLQALAGREVLDIGSGNGYYVLRMLGAGARSVVGLDPNLLFNLQFQAFNRFATQTAAAVLPLPGEYLLESNHRFDTVFSMGVLYHRREPNQHLQMLANALQPNGELVLETLVIEDQSRAPIAGQRYANMRNVWYLPNVQGLLKLLGQCGFRDAKCVDICTTTIQEQRATAWMQFHSLPQALDLCDPSLTIEGHPAPCRAIVIARK